MYGIKTTTEFCKIEVLFFFFVSLKKLNLSRYTRVRNVKIYLKSVGKICVVLVGSENFG